MPNSLPHDDEDKAYRDGDLPAEIWDYMKKEKFCLIIPEKYGGLGFSALGHSQVISALSSGFSLPLILRFQTLLTSRAF